MKILRLLSAAAILALAPVAMAGSSPATVVELFTSQGCSSCPPANKLVGKIAENPDQLVLSYGVTYWDYLGWKDTFGEPEYTARQRDYARALGIANVYTPQIVLNGSAHSSRYSRKDIESMPLSDSRPEATITQDGDKLVVRSTAPDDVTLLWVSYMPGTQDVDVSRGENRGRKLTLTNVVTDITALEWSGGEIFIDRPAEAGYNYAALFQDRNDRKIITAATYVP